MKSNKQKHIGNKTDDLISIVVATTLSRDLNKLTHPLGPPPKRTSPVECLL